jgi:hypothetical protein
MAPNKTKTEKHANQVFFTQANGKAKEFDFNELP